MDTQERCNTLITSTASIFSTQRTEVVKLTLVLLGSRPIHNVSDLLCCCAFKTLPIGFSYRLTWIIHPFKELPSAKRVLRQTVTYILSRFVWSLISFAPPRLSISDNSRNNKSWFKDYSNLRRSRSQAGCRNYNRDSIGLRGRASVMCWCYEVFKTQTSGPRFVEVSPAKDV